MLRKWLFNGKGLAQKGSMKGFVQKQKMILTQVYFSNIRSKVT